MLSFVYTILSYRCSNQQLQLVEAAAKLRSLLQFAITEDFETNWHGTHTIVGGIDARYAVCLSLFSLLILSSQVSGSTRPSLCMWKAVASISEAWTLSYACSSRKCADYSDYHSPLFWYSMGPDNHLENEVSMSWLLSTGLRIQLKK